MRIWASVRRCIPGLIPCCLGEGTGSLPPPRARRGSVVMGGQWQGAPSWTAPMHGPTGGSCNCPLPVPAAPSYSANLSSCSSLTELWSISGWLSLLAFSTPSWACSHSSGKASAPSLGQGPDSIVPLISLPTILSSHSARWAPYIGRHLPLFPLTSGLSLAWCGLHKGGSGMDRDPALGHTGNQSPTRNPRNPPRPSRCPPCPLGLHDMQAQLRAPRASDLCCSQGPGAKDSLSPPAPTLCKGCSQDKNTAGHTS